MTNQSKMMALKTRHHRKSRPEMMNHQRKSNFDLKIERYHLNFCKAMYFAFVKIPIYHIIIRGSYKIFMILALATIFFAKGFQSLANWIFNGPKKREEIFFKGYASVMGVMLALLGNGTWINVQDDVQFASAMRKQVPALQQMANEHAYMRTKLTSYKQVSKETSLQSARQALSATRNSFAHIADDLIEDQWIPALTAGNPILTVTQSIRTHSGLIARTYDKIHIGLWAFLSKHSRHSCL